MLDAPELCPSVKTACSAWLHPLFFLFHPPFIWQTTLFLYHNKIYLLARKQELPSWLPRWDLCWNWELAWKKPPRTHHLAADPCSSFRSNTGTAGDYGNGKDTACYISRAVKLLLLLDSVELSNATGEAALRDAGARPRTGTGGQGSRARLSHQNARGERERERGSGSAGTESHLCVKRGACCAVLCCESPFQMLRGAVLPSRD